MCTALTLKSRNPAKQFSAEPYSLAWLWFALPCLFLVLPVAVSVLTQASSPLLTWTHTTGPTLALTLMASFAITKLCLRELRKGPGPVSTNCVMGVTTLAAVHAATTDLLPALYALAAAGGAAGLDEVVRFSWCGLVAGLWLPVVVLIVGWLGTRGLLGSTAP